MSHADVHMSSPAGQRPDGEVIATETVFSRRTALRLFGGAGLLGAAAAATSCSAASGIPLATNLDRLRSEVAGRVLVPGDTGYDAERAAWNLTIEHHPQVIVAAKSPDDVAAAVRYATAAGLPVGVQAVGHGQASGNDSVLVSTKRLADVTIDPAAGIARVGAGAAWRPVIDAAAPHGLAPLNGSTSEISAVGYLTGGGMPVLGRRYGFAADHVRALEMVTADGALRRLTPDQQPELFFAVRGGTGNFGIVTAAEVDLMPQPRIYGGGLFYPGAIAGQVVRSWLDWIQHQPEEMCTSLALMRYPDRPEVPEPARGKFLVHLRVAHTGPPDEGERLLQPLRAMRPVADTIAELPYQRIDEVHQDPTQPAPIIESGLLLRRPDDGFVEQLLALAGEHAELPPGLVELRALGGALARPPAVPNAMGHRDAALSLLLAMVAGAPQTDQVRATQRRILDALAPWSTGGVFPNFLGGHADATRVRAAYREDDYRRLQKIKTVYDPTNTFRINHNIPPGR
jgi:FAD binding domain/Berberine and berberine like